MTSSIVKHWRNLKGSVHPEDQKYFDAQPHTFNLDFPPPAFIGDIENAPVVLLDANGGYDPKVTASEFLEANSVSRFIDLLHNPRQIDPSRIAPYYGKRNYAQLIRDGILVLVNAVAYRSKGISSESENKKLTELLPSTEVHRKWLRDELLLQAARGNRLVISHRNALWKLRKSEGPLPGVIFTTNPVSADLSQAVLDAISVWRPTPNAE
jgi:hypothetical protein